jgi:superfamily II DNA/RNA helicase
MLDMGFIPDIEEICTKLPSNRQTLLFSATMPAPIKKLADKFLSNPKTVEVARPASANTSIEQALVETTSRGKRETLRKLLQADDLTTAIVFSNRKTTVRELTESLRRNGFRASQIHGDMEQSERIRELDRFKSGEINILVASDVAARGLDIKGVSHVFNYDVPWHPDDYVHRIGRTGRAGAKGKAFTLVTPEDAEAIENIEKLTGHKIARVARAAPTEDTPSAEAAPPRRERAKRARPEKAGGVEKPARVEKSESIETPERVETAVRAERPAREERAPRRAERRPERHDDRRFPHTAEPADDGWNGPVPSFLAQGFTPPEE